MSNHPTNQSLTERARQMDMEGVPHPFRVGETYANRRGSYEVVQITPPKMTIRYTDGELVTADISILARIWHNLQLPPEQPESDTGTRTRSRRPAAQPRTAGPTAQPEPAQPAAAQPAAAQPRTRKAAPRSKKAAD